MPEPWSWGAAPLPEHPRLAAAVRAVTSLAVSLEQSDPALLDLVEMLEAAQDKLSGLAPESDLPRVGPFIEGPGRVYLDHCRDIGAWNPMFPRYDLAVAEEDRARGVVNFPVCYEGPAGHVNGGFLGVFFDCAVQHHNCQLGESGGTRNLDIRYRRPTPLLVDLEFEITRTVDERSVHSEVRLLRDGELLCSASTSAVRFKAADMTVLSPRR